VAPEEGHFVGEAYTVTCYRKDTELAPIAQPLIVQVREKEPNQGEATPGPAWLVLTCPLLQVASASRRGRRGGGGTGRVVMTGTASAAMLTTVVRAREWLLRNKAGILATCEPLPEVRA
jgi:hypothetical protein